MVNHSPRVSMGLPVYNGERFLEETLDSILAQTFEDYELSISDNASTDRTAEICQAYEARDKRIQYYRNPTNLGAVKNYHRLFQLSSGEYFRWVAGDDLLAPTFLERCVEALDREPTAVLAYPKTKWIDEHGRLLFDSDQTIPQIGWQAGGVDRYRHFVDECIYNDGWASAMCIFGLIRSSALRQTRLFGDFNLADCNLLAELILMGNFCEVPEFFSFLRHHPGSLSWHPTRSPRRSQQIINPAIKGYFSSLLFRWGHYLDRFVLTARSRLPLREKIVLVLYNIGPPLRRLRMKLMKPQGSQRPCGCPIGK